jgi:hypothetical protein
MSSGGTLTTYFADWQRKKRRKSEMDSTQCGLLKNFKGSKIKARVKKILGPASHVPTSPFN